MSTGLNQLRSRRSVSLQGGVVAVLVVVLDQAFKLWIVSDIMVPPRVIEVTSFFNIVMVWNQGVSFGMFGNDSPWTQVVLAGVALAMAAVLAVWLSRTNRRVMAWPLGMIIGGALGNVIDRARFGAVADFLDFHYAGYHWPAFNIADIGITVGVVLLVFATTFSRDV